MLPRPHPEPSACRVAVRAESNRRANPQRGLRVQGHGLCREGGTKIKIVLQERLGPVTQGPGPMCSQGDPAIQSRGACVIVRSNLCIRDANEDATASDHATLSQWTISSADRTESSTSEPALLAHGKCTFPGMNRTVMEPVQIRVLLVEDEPLCRRGLLRSLRMIPGVCAHAVGSATEAKARIDRASEDLIMLAWPGNA